MTAGPSREQQRRPCGAAPHLVLEGSAPGRPLGSGQCRIATVLLSEAIGANGGAVCDGRRKSTWCGRLERSERHFALMLVGSSCKSLGKLPRALGSPLGQRTCCASEPAWAAARLLPAHNALGHSALIRSNVHIICCKRPWRCCSRLPGTAPPSQGRLWLRHTSNELITNPIGRSGGVWQPWRAASEHRRHRRRRLPCICCAECRHACLTSAVLHAWLV